MRIQRQILHPAAWAVCPCESQAQDASGARTGAAATGYLPVGSCQTPLWPQLSPGQREEDVDLGTFTEKAGKEPPLVHKR